MADLIGLREYPVSTVLKILLQDKTTRKNIIFATDAYSDLNTEVKINARTQLSPDLILGLNANVIQPRVYKTLAEQNERTRKKAEVFTPAWICNKMNNHCDAEWFGFDNVFNIENGQEWTTTVKAIAFPEGKTWKKYIDSKRLEITCGEAPYLVSRYDAATGRPIPIRERIGILDRKLRIVNENTDNEDEWLNWCIRSFQSVYGYEFQGDNLLIARINLLITFVDYMEDRWGHRPTDAALRKIANIIVWNLWQMDGITGTVPYGKPAEAYRQISFFDYEQGRNDTESETIDCRIYDWRSNKSISYRSIKEGK
ncbi:MAG: restriction endonuclease subunit M [Lachnospiraceae bacterium]|nr:restriction endonuclease subunit M [Lachnospiraceae bacterium]